MATTLYRPEYIERAREMCLGGATNADLATEFGVGTSTIKSWQAKFPEFRDVMVAAKDVADTRVERSLYERATGYTYDAVKIFCGKDGQVTEVPYKEHVPPDTTAQIFWLKNRKPGDWRDKHEFEGEIGIKTVMVAKPIKDVTQRPAPKPAFES